jgi:hypothetical protein
VNVLAKPFPKIADFLLFVVIYLATTLATFILADFANGLSTFMAFVPHALGAAFVTWKSAGRSGMNSTNRQALKFALWTAIPTVFVFGLFAAIVVVFTSPPGQINWNSLEFFVPIWIGAVLLSIVVSWLFSLLGAWLARRLTVQKVSQ